MYECLADTILLGYVTEFEEVFEAGVYATVAGESHEMHSLAFAYGILECALHLGVLHDAVVTAGTVDFHKILIDDTSAADVEVANL